MQKRTNYFKYFVFIILLLAPFSLFAEKHDHQLHTNLWEHWTKTPPTSKTIINHSAWDGFLKKYVKLHTSGINLVDYRSVTDVDKQHLSEYIQYLSSIDISKYNRKEQLAYWINFYNAIIIELVLKHFPISSILDVRISPGFYVVGPWGAKLVTVEKQKLSLDDIMQRILRPIWQDPRIHFLVCQGAIGSPNIYQHAFTSENIEPLLQKLSEDYINSLRGVQVIDKKLVVSGLFDWYRDDFGNTDANIIEYIQSFAHHPLRGELANLTTITETIFNWNLNRYYPGRLASSHHILKDNEATSVK